MGWKKGREEGRREGGKKTEGRKGRAGWEDNRKIILK